MVHMKRVQIQFPDDMAAALLLEALEAGQPVSAIVRGAVGRMLEASERDRLWDRAIAAVTAGGFGSGLHDVSENHDEYYVQTIEERIGRR